ncbi:MAG: hypothetical protein E7376_05505 [Clostridiales bacterium]|nr:hypothetical protein [Clostridiales bacterium]
MLEANKEYLTYIKDSATVSTSTTPLEIRGADASLSFGDKYFSDLTTSGKPQDIKVVLTFTNVSEFNVLAKADLTLSTSSNTSILINADKTALLLDQTGETATASITFTLSLQPDENGEYQSITTAASISLNISLEKCAYASTDMRTDISLKTFTTTEQEAIKTAHGDTNVWQTYSYTDTILCYAERYPYYIEMGTEVSTGTKLRWLVVGTDDGVGNLQALTDEDRIVLGLGYMLKDTQYYLLSEKILYTESTTNFDLSFQNAYTNSGDYLNTKYGVKANDYATSTIREYLKGGEVNREATLASGVFSGGGTLVTFANTYSFTSEETNKIVARPLADLYNEEAIANEVAEMKTVPTSTTSTPVNTTADNFWILSQTEMETIFADDYIAGSREIYGTPIFMSARTSVQGSSEYAASWWFRSLDISSSKMTRYIMFGGDVYNTYVTDLSIGIRPAFKI